jgi:PPM family protein phosphatase
VVPRLGLALVADGMGGHHHGDIASRTAVDTFEQCFDRLGGVGLTIDETRQRVLRCFREANARVGEHPAARDDRMGMGTTLVATAFAHGQLVVAHVGDSRCYRLRDGWLELLTADHSYAAALRRSGIVDTPAADSAAARWENVLTRAVNGREPLEVDLEIARCKPGDVYLLCSDGLWGAVRADLVALILSTAADAVDACKRLIGAAWAGGGLDNIGVAVVRLMPPVLRLDDPSKLADPRDEATRFGPPT